MLRVNLDARHAILAYLSSKMRKNYIAFCWGRAGELADLTRGRIIYRFRRNQPEPVAEEA
jgi:translation initiation factor IF-1